MGSICWNVFVPGASGARCRALRRFPSFWLVALCGVAALGGARAGDRYEAEGGKLGGTEISSARPGFSGEGYVSSLDRKGDFVEISAKVARAGFYALSVRYAADQEKYNPISVNGSMQRNCPFPATREFAWTKVGRIFLAEGENAIRISRGWGYTDIDCIEIETAPEPEPFRIDPAPSNPAASLEARKLYAELWENFGKNLISGQQDMSGTRVASIAEMTGGRAPAILGLDLQNYTSAYNHPDGQIEKAKSWVLEKGGIITLSWHWLSPWGATGEVWKSFCSKETTFDAAKIADETSPEYAAVIRDIDMVAEQLKILRDAGVPVLWRPLHEAEGKWFWWGASGPETCKRLYRLMHNRFTRIHGLDNLLWVWTTSGNPASRDWYPGDDCVDIVGCDLYSDGIGAGTYLPVFDNVRELFGGKKMIALSETDAVPDPGLLQAEGANWSWFLVWDDFIVNPGLNPRERVRAAYSGSKILSDIPWRK